jgi:spermidine/putrescine transport system substrate-binding protein
MTTRDPVDKLLSGRMDRRSFNKTLASLGLGLAAGPMMSRSALAAEEQANYFTWSGYEIPEFHQSYLKKYGESPTSSFFGGSSEGMKKFRPDSRLTSPIPARTTSRAGRRPVSSRRSTPAD